MDELKVGQMVVILGGSHFGGKYEIAEVTSISPRKIKTTKGDFKNNYGRSSWGSSSQYHANRIIDMTVEEAEAKNIEVEKQLVMGKQIRAIRDNIYNLNADQINRMYAIMQEVV